MPVVLVDADGAEITTIWLERWLLEAVAEVVADPRSRYESLPDALDEIFEAAALEYMVFGRVPASCLSCAMLGTPYQDHEFVPQPWASLPEAG